MSEDEIITGKSIQAAVELEKAAKLAIIEATVNGKDEREANTGHEVATERARNRTEAPSLTQPMFNTLAKDKYTDLQ